VGWRGGVGRGRTSARLERAEEAVGLVVCCSEKGLLWQTDMRVKAVRRRWRRVRIARRS